MVGSVPFVHLVQMLFVCTQYQFGTLGEGLTLLVSEDASYLQQLVFVDVQSRHLAVHPQEPVHFNY